MKRLNLFVNFLFVAGLVGCLLVFGVSFLSAIDSDDQNTLVVQKDERNKDKNDRNDKNSKESNEKKDKDGGGTKRNSDGGGTKDGPKGSGATS